MFQSEPWGAVTVPMEAQSKQRGQPPRIHESGELKHGQKGQRVSPVPLIEGNCNHQVCGLPSDTICELYNRVHYEMGVDWKS